MATPAELNTYLLAGATLLSGAGVGTVFEDVPLFFTNLFKNHLFKYFVLVALVWQSGQTIRVSLVSAAIFMFIVYGLKYIEDLQKFRTNFFSKSIAMDSIVKKCKKAESEA